ncbi:MAG: sulfatase-like hydrolase/transferase [Lentisphaerales bacterium]|nr:sulfatase-like hydrolase/transferase [Lentisphaerales bacterium]
MIRTLLLTLFFLTTVNAANKPNIIIFLVDDMGLMDTSEPMLSDENGIEVRHPLNEWYRTPNMEKLASTGIKFSRFYAHSVCSPSRASILTGQNSARHKTTTWINSKKNNRGSFGPQMWNWQGLTKSDVTLPRILQQVGYETIHVGKAHFGPNNSEGANPLNLGFNVNIGGNSGAAPKSYLPEKGYGKYVNKGYMSFTAVPGLEEYYNSSTFLTEALTLEANKEIERCTNENKPFFLYMSHYAAHSPFEIDDRFIINYKDPQKSKEAQSFATLIEGIDKSLGDIHKQLNKLNIGDDTIIIFLGDNGSDARLGKSYGHFSSAPIRGMKATAFEGGMRVPFIASWGKRNSQNKWQQKLPITQNGFQHQISTIMDIMPTICNLAGVDIPEGYTIDGNDLKTQFSGKLNLNRDNSFLNHFPHDHRSSYFTSYTKGDWKVIYNYPVGKNKKHSYLLYNLRTDPYEKEDLSEKHPEKLTHMMQKLVDDLIRKKALYPVNRQGQTVEPKIP